jgi:uncharacterized protein involved in exopolysaccharide biosynthesis
MENTQNYPQNYYEEDEIDLIELWNTIWAKKWFVIKFSAVFAIVAIIYSLTLDNIYKAQVTMLPQSKESGASKFSGLAALAGIDLSSAATNNEVFYEDVLKSDKVLNKLISKKWSIEETSSDMFLHDFLEMELNESHFSPKEKQKYDLKKYLRSSAISFSSSKENGLMTLSVSMPKDPKLAAELANYLARELHEFNEEYRQEKAVENVNTVKKQLDDAKKELVKAENNLKNFQKENKTFLSSPDLQLEFARFQREVLTESTVYTELRKQFELAKIDLEKSKETITVLDPAIPPVEKDEPKRSLIVIVVTMLGGILSIFWVLVRNKFSSETEDEVTP